MRSARHEAAHALLALAVGMDVHSLVVRDDGSGCCEFSEARCSARGKLRARLAGIVATGSEAGADDDLEKAGAIAWYVADVEGGTIEAVLAEERARVATYLTAHAAQLERLAAALHARRALDADDIRAIVPELCPPPRPTQWDRLIRLNRRRLRAAGRR